MRVALSLKVKERRLGTVPHIRWSAVKTKAFAKRFCRWHLITGWTWAGRGREVFLLATRNPQAVEVMKIQDVQVYHLLKWPRVILDLKALQWIEALGGHDLLEEPKLRLPGLSRLHTTLHVRLIGPPGGKRRSL